MPSSRRQLCRSSVVEDNFTPAPSQVPGGRSLSEADITLGSIATLSRLQVGQKTPKVRCLKTGKNINSGAFNHPVVILAISRQDNKEATALCCQISGNSNPIASEAPSFIPISSTTLGREYSCVPKIRSEAVLEDRAMFKSAIS